MSDVPVLTWKATAQACRKAVSNIERGLAAPGSTTQWSAESALLDARDGTAEENTRLLIRLAGYLIMTGEITDGVRGDTQLYHLIYLWERTTNPDPFRIINVLRGLASLAEHADREEMR